LNQRVLVGVLSDLTLAFEATFIFLMWVRAARPILFVIGLGLHLSIVFAFPIPFFGLSLAGMYFLLAPEHWYDALGRRLRLTGPRAIVYFDAESPRWRTALMWFEHFDIRGSLAFRPVRGGEMAEPVTDGLLVVQGDQQFTGTDALVAAARCHSLRWLLAFPLTIALQIRARSPDEDHAANSAARRAPTRSLIQRMREANVAYRSSAGSVDSLLAGAAGGTTDAALRVKFAIVVLCVLIQATLIPKAPCFNDDNGKQVAMPRWLSDIQKAAHGFAGICSHGVFLDGHFANYDHIVAVTLIRPDGSETWLPLTTPKGQMGWMATGRIWAKWAFRGNAQYMSIEHLKLALRDLTGFWARKNDVDLADAHFNVLVKKYEKQAGWQVDFLKRQAEKPWSVAGTVHWKNGAFSADIINIEAL
jgi:hypothetical protein